ncbi:RNA polymerase factor sigma-70 [Clostridium puniceum]|uniref:RNA polymerase factor sigma-70 n=1 Tax=Clostridium puniceum TaxID=29367 RepID=A0A1S8T7P5_9CLOT|nr:sigma factor [Clostridium puniceum]OOM73763.1 RNA polymerase factor sigma-70 [Clostridium puniceum]
MKKENFLKSLRKHNPKALDYVFDNYGNLIFKAAYSVLNNRSLSEECVNDVLFKIWNNIDSFKREDDEFKNSVQNLCEVFYLSISLYAELEIKNTN